MFPDWTDQDVVMALEETDGDLERTVERISEGKDFGYFVMIYTIPMLSKYIY